MSMPVCCGYGKVRRDKYGRKINPVPVSEKQRGVPWFSPDVKKRSNGEPYFVCHHCGAEVGTYNVLGKGLNDYYVQKSDRCSECGNPVDWSEVNFKNPMWYNK